MNMTSTADEDHLYDRTTGDHEDIREVIGMRVVYGVDKRGRRTS
jgi:hypothetical protein